MNPHKLSRSLLLIITAICCSDHAFAQKTAAGRRTAVVVDERLSALRSTPDPLGKLIRRLGRGRLVVIWGLKKTADGLVFLRVSVSSRTHGWIQREAVVSAAQKDDDKRLHELIINSRDFDRIARARIFLDLFTHSPLRARVLLIFGEAAEEAAIKLSRDAARKIVGAQEYLAPEFSYFLNYSALDRYNRQGVKFTFNQNTKQFQYEGTAWRELIRKYPTSAEAVKAREWLNRGR